MSSVLGFGLIREDLQTIAYLESDKCLRHDILCTTLVHSTVQYLMPRQVYQTVVVSLANRCVVSYVESLIPDGCILQFHVVDRPTLVITRNYRILENVEADFSLPDGNFDLLDRDQTLSPKHDVTSQGTFANVRYSRPVGRDRVVIPMFQQTESVKEDRATSNSATERSVAHLNSF